MIKINKNEREYLLSKGVPCGENGISRTHSHKVKYFMCESSRNVSLLNEYKKQIKSK